VKTRKKGSFRETPGHFVRDGRGHLSESDHSRDLCEIRLRLTQRLLRLLAILDVVQRARPFDDPSAPSRSGTAVQERPGQ
jgi:hypothetical protein